MNYKNKKIHKKFKVELKMTNLQLYEILIIKQRITKIKQLLTMLPIINKKKIKFLLYILCNESQCIE